MRPLPRRAVLGLSLGVLAGLTLAPARLFADEVQVSATLGADQVEVGQGVYLQIEVATERDIRIADPEFPGLKDVEVMLESSSSGMSVQFINGKRSAQRTKTFMYVLVPTAPGDIEIPVEVEVGSEKFSPASKPKLTVTGSAIAAAPAEQPEVGALPPSAEREVYVWPVVDAAEVYVGEQLVYELQIWSRSVGRLELDNLPAFKDAWTTDLQIARPKQRKQLDGVPYQVFTQMRRAVFPHKAGTMTIEGATVRATPSLGFFGGGGGPPRTYVGRTLAIPVKPLPAEGQPIGFAASNVGRFALAAEVDRTQLRQGEAVRLSVTIEGSGNLELVELRGWPKIDGVRSYEPKAEAAELDTRGPRLRGTRVWTMLLIIDRAGELEIPSIELPYFDPEDGKYQVALTKPIKLTVEPNPDALTMSSEAEQPADPSDGRDAELLAGPLAGDVLERVEPREPWLTPRRWRFGILAAPALLGTVWLARKLYARLGPSEQARREASEQDRRRRLLGSARASVEQGEGFHARLAELLQGIALARAGEQGIGLARAPLMALLRQRGVPSDEVERLQALLDECDAARFGAGSGDPESRRAQLERAQALIDSKTWKVRG